MENKNKRINIMTSCDDNLTNYIFVQLRTIAMHLKNKEIHFYLFYNRISEEKLEKLKIYCECLGNIEFHEVFIEEIEPYIELSKNGSGRIEEDKDDSTWPYEAYFSFECHRYLPDDIDRIIYIDAGDVLFAGEIDEYYFDDFEGKSLIVSRVLSKPNGKYFNSGDLKNAEFLKRIKRGIFNSGSYVINVDKFRKDAIPMEEFVKTAKSISVSSKNDMRYFGDQGLLSIFFIEKMKYFKYPEVKNVWYQQYNFTMVFYRKDGRGSGTELWYDPKIIHLVDAGVKPWKLMDVLLKEGFIEVGQKMNTSEFLELASNIKQKQFKYIQAVNPESKIIEPEMTPFFEYWFNINNMVQMELEEIFENKSLQ